MSFFKKLTDKAKDSKKNPLPNLGSNNPFLNSISQKNSGSTSEKYQPPPGPPPSHNNYQQQQPSQASSSDYQPPPGPPPSYPQQPAPSWQPPPSYHDWTVIPDNSLLPPPPSIGYETSPTANASGDEGYQADQWCKANPLWPPQPLTQAQHAAVQNGALQLLKPPTYLGDLLPQRQLGHWKCRTHAKCRDSSLLTALPAYSELWDSPLRTGRAKTIYFELKVLGIGRGISTFSEADAGIAVGFVAPPYPTFRLPGWQRGSLGVHGDDGRKYVNDTYGGVDFTTAFKPGETVGIGITFAPPSQPPSYEQTQVRKVLDINVFFTRNGAIDGNWDGNAELDERCEGGTVGLRGECDLFPAVGVFGGVDFEVFFNPEQWLFNPY